MSILQCGMSNLLWNLKGQPVGRDILWVWFCWSGISKLRLPQEALGLGIQFGFVGFERLSLCIEEGRVYDWDSFHFRVVRLLAGRLLRFGIFEMGDCSGGQCAVFSDAGSESAMVVSGNLGAGCTAVFVQNSGHVEFFRDKDQEHRHSNKYLMKNVGAIWLDVQNFHIGDQSSANRQAFVQNADSD